MRGMCITKSNYKLICSQYQMVSFIFFLYICVGTLVFQKHGYEHSLNVDLFAVKIHCLTSISAILFGMGIHFT